MRFNFESINVEQVKRFLSGVSFADYVDFIVGKSGVKIGVNDFVVKGSLMIHTEVDGEGCFPVSCSILSKIISVSNGRDISFSVNDTVMSVFISGTKLNFNVPIIPEEERFIDSNIISDSDYLETEISPDILSEIYNDLKVSKTAKSVMFGSMGFYDGVIEFGGSSHFIVRKFDGSDKMKCSVPNEFYKVFGVMSKSKSDKIKILTDSHYMVMDDDVMKFWVKMSGQERSDAFDLISDKGILHSLMIDGVDKLNRLRHSLEKLSIPLTGIEDGLIKFDMDGSDPDTIKMSVRDIGNRESFELFRFDDGVYGSDKEFEFRINLLSLKFILSKKKSFPLVISVKNNVVIVSDDNTDEILLKYI